MLAAPADRSDSSAPLIGSLLAGLVRVNATLFSTVPPASSFKTAGIREWIQVCCSLPAEKWRLEPETSRQDVAPLVRVHSCSSTASYLHLV